MTVQTKTKTTVFDPVTYLDNEEVIAFYLEDAFETGDPADIADALGDIARTRGLAQAASDAGLSTYMDFATLLRVIRILGLEIAVRSSAKPVS